MSLAVPYPAPSAVTSITMTSAFWNANVRDAIGFLCNPPILRIHATAAQALAATTWTKITFGTIDVDSYTGWSVANNRYVAQVAGWHEVRGSVAASASASMAQFAGLYKNGSQVYGAQNSTVQNSSGLGGATATVSDQIYLNVGDYVELWGWFSAGVNTFITAPQTSVLNVRWMHY